MGFSELAEGNPGLVVRTLGDKELSRYARVLESRQAAQLVELCDRVTAIDPENNKYVASEPQLELEPFVSLFEERFGSMEVQIGYCNGPNSSLNALEWHKSPEIDIAVTDLVLLLGSRGDVGPDGHYDSKNLECFYLPKGSVVELLPEVLHYSPCRALRGGFKSVIVLPKGTNAPLGAAERGEKAKEGGTKTPEWPDIEPRLLFMRNKWLIAHPERKALLARGAFPGIDGENIAIVPAD